MITPEIYQRRLSFDQRSGFGRSCDCTKRTTIGVRYDKIGALVAASVGGRQRVSCRKTA